MKINCLGCGHNLDCDSAYDDYDGRVRCFACGTILEIKTSSGRVQSVQIAAKVRQTDKPPDAAPAAAPGKVAPAVEEVAPMESGVRPS
jgi:ribosomal protein S27E